MLYVIGGPDGAGKTTFAKQFLPAVGVREFLNGEMMAEGLSPLVPEAAGFRAGRLLLSRWQELVAARASFAVETTLSARSYVRLLTEAKERGYRLRCAYLGLATVRHSILRVRERVKKGGQEIPVADLKRRFMPSLRHFFEIYRPLSDDALLFDTTSWLPRLLAQWHGDQIHISEPERYDEIRRSLTRGV